MKTKNTYIEIIKENKYILLCSITYLFLGIEIADLALSRLGVYSVFECIYYYLLQINLPFCIIASLILTRKKDSISILHKIIFILFSSFYYWGLSAYIAYNIWHTNIFIIEAIKFTVIQIVIAFAIYKYCKLDKYKLVLFNTSLVFIFTSLIALSYSYYKHINLIDFCKTISTEAETLYCLKKLDYNKIGYTDNTIIGKNAAFLFSNNPKFKFHAERLKNARIVIKNDTVEWIPKNSR